MQYWVGRLGECVNKHVFYLKKINYTFCFPTICNSLAYAGLLEPSHEALLTAWRVRIQRENPDAPELKVRNSTIFQHFLSHNKLMTN